MILHLYCRVAHKITQSTRYHWEPLALHHVEELMAIEPALDVTQGAVLTAQLLNVNFVSTCSSEHVLCPADMHRHARIDWKIRAVARRDRPQNLIFFCRQGHRRAELHCLQPITQFIVIQHPVSIDIEPLEESIDFLMEVLCCCESRHVPQNGVHVAMRAKSGKFLLFFSLALRGQPLFLLGDALNKLI